MVHVIKFGNLLHVKYLATKHVRNIGQSFWHVLLAFISGQKSCKVFGMLHLTGVKDFFPTCHAVRRAYEKKMGEGKLAAAARITFLLPQPKLGENPKAVFFWGGNGSK